GADHPHLLPGRQPLRHRVARRACRGAAAGSGAAAARVRSAGVKLLHVVPTYLPAQRYGGPIFAVHGLCRALAARGHEVTVFTTNVDGASVSDVPVNEPVMLDGVRVRYFASSLRRLYVSPWLRDA